MKITPEDLNEENWKKISAREILATLDSHVDEALWNKAKRASQEAFNEIRWPFVMYLYTKWGGK